MSGTLNILYVTVKGLRLTSSQQLGLYVRRFSTGGFRCDVATYKTLDEAGELQQMGVGMHRLPGLRGWRRPAAFLRRPATLRALAGIVRERDIRLVHSFQTSSAPYAMALSRRAGVPHIVQVRNTYDSAAHYLRFGLHEARVLLMLSDSMLQHYRDLVDGRARPDQRQEVIPNGIDIAAYEQRALGRDVRRELGIAPDAPVVGLVGALSERKDTLLAVEVAALVRAARPDVRFLFAGDWSDAAWRARVMERVTALGLSQVCLFAGFQAEMAPWYRGMDLLLHTAWREGHPKVFNEAMVFSLPIVSSRIPGSRDVVADGETGLLCDTGNAPEFARAVGRLLDSDGLRRQMGAAGRLRVARHYSAEASLDRLAELYRDVAAGH